MSEQMGHRVLRIEEAVLGKNDQLAERNRARFKSDGVFVLNVLSSPGSGKTTFLERMLTDLNGKLQMGVIVGDLETDNDAKRLRDKGAPVTQITTGGICHLDADMVSKAYETLTPRPSDLLIIENVGNLVCPASYDLGEDMRMVMLSVTEGEDKPLKYPVVFHSAQVVIVSKVDIAEVCGFDRDAALTNIRRVAPKATIFELSARTGLGMDDWYTYLKEKLPEQRKAGSVNDG
ncbi:MAG: hydrogenase nickel incorporation protein HypB [bacterium]